MDGILPDQNKNLSTSLVVSRLLHLKLYPTIKDYVKYMKNKKTKVSVVVIVGRGILTPYIMKNHPL